jgi:hypothetical protein
VGLLLVGVVVAVAIAIVMLFVTPERAERALQASRDWLLRNERNVAAVIVFLLAASLLRNGIAGLAN